jgi:phosphohistidine phosphatase
MSELYIVRHGIAVEPGTPDIADDDRPLTSKGERRMAEIAEALDRLDLDLERIVTSPLPRALKTAEIVADELGLSTVLEQADALRSGQSASTIRDWLRTRAEDRLMIVGHNPALSDLIGLLLLDDERNPVFELKKGGVAALSRSGDPATGRYTLDWIATPRLLRRLAD